jgi:lysophospholipase L1-like esterase
MTAVKALGFLLIVLAVVALARKTRQAISGDPAFWEGEIGRLERQDRDGRPSGVILFTGSSSIRFWRALAEDMAPLPVLNRGFGGAQIHQVTHYAERIIRPYDPRAVVLYAGENDMSGAKFAQAKSPQDILAAFQQFCETVHGWFPDIPIYFVSIKPPKLRLRFWPEMQRANTLVEEFTRSDPRLQYIDVVPAMLDAGGAPRRDLFRWDGIHLNEEGYAVWKRVIRPVLERDLGAP